MSTFYIKNEQINGDKAIIQGEDVKHIKNVLRYKISDCLDVCDENGIRYKTKIANFLNDKIELNILEISDETTEAKINISLFQGLPKSDKMDLIIQKCTELGVKSIIPIITERVITKVDDKNETKKSERWQKIAKEASKQSGRQIVPLVEKVTNLKNIIEKLSKYDIVIVPYECEKNNMLKNVLRKTDIKLTNVAIVIGPEGGFSDNDIDLLRECKNIEMVSLGPRILRTETAGLATLSMLMYELDN